MSAKINNQDNIVSIVNAGPWKIVVALLLVMITVLSLFILPAAKAEEDTFVSFLPIVAKYAPLPGTTGTVVFTVNSGVDREIYSMNADGSGKNQLTDNDVVDDHPSWSADGRIIAFTSDRRKEGDYEIYTMNPDGSGVERITSSQWDDNSPSFSPDGDKIVFASNRNGPFQIFVMNSDGSDQTPLTADNVHSGSPAWSPDGKKIAYASQEPGGDVDIYVMNPDGSNKKRLTTAVGFDFSPAWSPDSSKIVFTSLRDGDRRIYVMNAGGSDEKRLTDFYSDWSNWSPDGARIVFTRRDDETATSSSAPRISAPEDAGLLFAHPQGVDEAEQANSDLLTMKPDGSDKQPFTDTPDDREDRGNWGP